jgi:acyl-CoA synthetase (AMP-forming)/AMP-acid ligase II
VLHTTNIRLFPEQVAWVFDHAGDSLVFVDASLAATCYNAMQTFCEKKLPLVVMGESDAAPGSKSYEELIAGRPETFPWPDVDERAGAILCYTSATTGDPKGVVFTHRSTVLHVLAAGLTGTLGITQRDTVMPVVPMFHVTAWGIPFLAPMVGAKLVFPGPKLDPASVIELVRSEKVTMSLGVPTVWLAVRDALEKDDAYLPTLERLVIGGSACPPSLFDDLKKRRRRTRRRARERTTRKTPQAGPLRTDRRVEASRRRRQRRSERRQDCGQSLGSRTRGNGIVFPARQRFAMFQGWILSYG